MAVKALFAWYFALFMVFVSPAQGADVALVLSDRGGVYSEFAEVLQKSLEGSAWRISAVITPEALGSVRSANAWVTVGSEATRVALAQGGKSPAVLAVLLTRQTFERLLTEAGTTRPKAGLSAIVLDQPLERQVNLITQIFPEKKRMGLLIGPENEAARNQMRKIAAKYGLSLEVEEAGEDGAVVPSVNRLLARSDVLLALPDRLIYHRNNVRPILLASYYYQRPVVGYSAAFATAGASVALFSTPAQIARQASGVLLSGRKDLPLVMLPEKFSLTYNRQVLRSLGLSLVDEGTVISALEAVRHEP